MKKLLLSFTCLSMSAFAIAQTTIYQENFESGNSFTLNTPDLGGASTYNTWLVNNTYTGGSGTLVCMGFPFTFTVPNTPSQPGGITGAPSSTYMHISAQAAVSSGVNCASYIPSDGGTCVSDETNFAKLTSPISTSGYTGVSIDFWWMCAGSTTGFGELYYSLDNGVTWTLKQTNFNNVTTWSQTSISDPAWDNQSSLLFGFRFVNNTSSNAADPSFSIDEILVTGVASSSNTITTSTNIVPAVWCEGQTITTQVNFTSTGTFNAGNVYTAELSDATGSFAAPTNIGTLTSSSNSGLITALIPGGTPAGNGYRIRVVSDNPTTVGSDNGSDLFINALPTVMQAPFSDVCSTGGVVNLVGGSPSGGSYSGTGTSGSQFDPSVSGVGSFPLTYSYTDGNGCANSATESITVIQGPTVTLAPYSDVCDTDPFFTLTGGNPSNGTYSGPGVTAGVFNPSSAGVGVHTITYTFTDGNGCDGTAFETITVNDCASLSETSLNSFQLMPNPANSKVEIVTSGKYDHIELIDMQGRVLQQHGAETNSFDVSGLSGGVYIVRVKFGSSMHEERLIIR